MGAIFSRFRSKQDDNFEKILSELDDDIRRAEIRLREIRIRERNALIILIVYSLLAYVTYVAGYWYFVYMSVDEEGWDLMKVAPVLTGPFFVVIGYRFVALWYKRKETNEVTQLEHLRAKQKLKVEELKKKTGYYTTKTLLERYDSPKGPTNQSQTPGQKGPNGKSVQQGQQINPNLRQRIPNSQIPPESSGPLPITPGGDDTSQSINRPAIDPITPIQRHWYDKLVDVLVGDEEQKYALICQNCFTWNGLAYPADYEDVQYRCKNCNHFNPSRRNQREGTSINPSSNLTNGNNNGVNGKNGNSLIMTNNHRKQRTDPSQLGDNTTTPRRGRSTTPKPMSRNSSSDNEYLVDKDDYDDDGVAVSKQLASRSTSRKRRSSRSQNRIGSRHGSDDDYKPYSISDEGDDVDGQKIFT